MLRRTFGSVKAELSRLAGTTGMNTSDPRVMAYTNSAIEELMNEGDWPTIIDRLRFTLTQRTFVLPSDYDRMMYCTVDTVPVQMQSPWYEFVGYGMELASSVVATGTEESVRYLGVLDKENAATFEDIPATGGPYYPRVYGQTDERVDGVRPNLILQGYDENGDWIRSSDGAGGFIDGVSIAINGDTAPYYIQTTQAFSYVTASIKPVTKKNVMVKVYNGANEGTYIAQYAAGDTTPIYRQYSIPNLFFPVTSVVRCVLARCRRRYVPIRSDSDFLLISNLPALKAMIQAVYFLEANEPENYVKYKLTAIDILRKEAKAFIGLSNQKPIITMSESPGTRNDGLYIL